MSSEWFIQFSLFKHFCLGGQVCRKWTSIEPFVPSLLFNRIRGRSSTVPWRDQIGLQRTRERPKECRKSNDPSGFTCLQDRSTGTSPSSLESREVNHAVLEPLLFRMKMERNSTHHAQPLNKTSSTWSLIQSNDMWLFCRISTKDLRSSNELSSVLFFEFSSVHTCLCLLKNTRMNLFAECFRSLRKGIEITGIQKCRCLQHRSNNFVD